MVEESVEVPQGLTTDGLLGRRYLARGIDSVCILLLIGAFFLIEGAILSPVTQSSSLLLTVLNLPLLVILWIGYGAAFESSAAQATPGKRLMGIRVYDARGERPDFFQAARRNLVKDGPFLLISFIPGGRLLSLLWLIAHLVVMHRSPVYQAIHDRFASTWVAAPEATTQLHIA